MKISIGDPVILVNDSNLTDDYALVKGDTGWASNLIDIEGDRIYIVFMPNNQNQAYVVDASRFKLDAEEKEKIEALRKETPVEH